jgi:hypothetical protein
MNTPRVHPPPRSETGKRRRKLVFDRRYVSPCAGVYEQPGCCDNCGRELVLLENQRQRYCGSACRKEILRLPHEERAQRREQTPEGLCVNCGVELPPALYRCPRSRKAWIKRWRAASGGKLRFGSEAFEWLGGKLGLDPSDERLPAIALALGRAGQLAVLVDGGQVVGIAKPRIDDDTSDGRLAR